MHLMHDTYLFIYLMGTFLSVMLARLASPDITPTEAFRHDGLVRLYAAYLLFVLANKFSGSSSSSPFGDISFDHWFMFYFNDLQLWERQQFVEESNIPTVFTNLMLASEKPGIHSSRKNAYYSFNGQNEEPAYGNQRSVVEILRRVTMLAKQHWYVLDLRLQGGYGTATPQRKGEHADYHDWLPWKPQSNAMVRSIIKNPASRLAPAPFCCVRHNQYMAENYDETQNLRVPFIKRRIPLELFFHRMYVNVSTQFGTRSELHNMMERSDSCIFFNFIFDKHTFFSFFLRLFMARYLPSVYQELRDVRSMERWLQKEKSAEDRQRQATVLQRRGGLPRLGGI